MSRGKTQLSKPLITQAPRWAAGKGAQLSRGLRTRLPMQGMLGQIPGSGRSPGGGNGNPLRYSGLEKPMDREAWWATVHGVERLSDVTEQLHSHNQHASLCFIHFSLNVCARKLIQTTALFLQRLCTNWAKLRTRKGLRRKPPKCPSPDEWIRKTWYICRSEYYSAIKKNHISPSTAM